MAQDAGLAFAQNLVNNYMHFKALQFQVQCAERQEERYIQQMADINRRFLIREERLGTSPTAELGRLKLGWLTDPTITAEEKAKRESAAFGAGTTINIGATEREKTAESLATVDSLYNLKRLYDSAKTRTGPFYGRVAPVIGQFGLTSEEQEEFMAATSAFKNKIIREITGAQMSEPEAQRIMKQIPDITDHSTRWEAKWRQSLQNLQYLQNRRAEIQGGMTPTPWIPPAEELSSTLAREPLFKEQTARFTYPYKKPESKQVFLDMVRHLHEIGETEGARRYYEQWSDTFDWEEE